MKKPFVIKEALDDLSRCVDEIDENARQAKWKGASGWFRLYDILEQAKLDKEIAKSRGASEFLEVVCLITRDAIAYQAPDAEEAFWTLGEILQRLMTEKYRQGRINEVKLQESFTKKILHLYETLPNPPRYVADWLDLPELAEFKIAPTPKIIDASVKKWKMTPAEIRKEYISPTLKKWIRDALPEGALNKGRPKKGAVNR